MAKLTITRQLLLSLFAVLYLCACSGPDYKKVSLEGGIMGTTYHVTCITSSTENNQADIQAKIDAVLTQINQVASTYIDDSELSLFNSAYSHLINPKTGTPITHRAVSVTVIHPYCMVADDLSAGFMVMGVEKAVILANQHNIATLFIT